MTTIKTEYGYQCCFCKREYKEKFNYDRHTVCCEFLCKSRREQRAEIDAIDRLPTHKEMYLLIQELALRNEKLEKELAKLKHVQKQKMNILDWLNSPQAAKTNPTISFTDWISQTVYKGIPDVLKIVYENNLTVGLTKLFENVLEQNNIPIRAFENKNNSFYVFETNANTDPAWKLLSTAELNNVFEKISHQFIVQFKNHWFIPNQHRVESDESYKDLYINYYQRILGGNERLSEDGRHHKLKLFIYGKIKQNIKQIIEYDFA
jgi:hypothetical protein